MNERPAPMLWYDWLMSIAAIWVSGGMMIDSWHHFHEDVETFFEPAHGVLYAGLAAAFIFTAVAMFVNHRKGFPLRRALPEGYQATVAGLIIFALGGLGDLIKHSFWGFEQFFDALLSPTHLAIGLGMFLMMAGPIASAFVRKNPPRTFVAQLPMMLAAASMMELVHWGLQFVVHTAAAQMNAPLPLSAFPHDTITLLALRDYKQGIGLSAVTFQGLLLAGFLVYFGRRIRLAFGAVTVIFVLGNSFIAAAQSNYIGEFASIAVASLVAGLFADWFALGPATREGVWMRCAFFMPIVYWCVNLAVLGLTMHGLWWTPDVIVGSILFAGFAGLFINAIAMPVPAAPTTT